MMRELLLAIARSLVLAILVTICLNCWSRDFKNLDCFRSSCRSKVTVAVLYRNTQSNEERLDNWAHLATIVLGLGTFNQTLMITTSCLACGFVPIDPIDWRLDRCISIPLRDNPESSYTTRWFF